VEAVPDGQAASALHVLDRLHESQHEADEDQQQADGNECFAGMHGL
jgi:hypothetical protein